MSRAADLQAVEETIGYRFTQPALLARALSHRSVGVDNNERLEFLGDAVLDLVVSEALFRTHGNASEGELTRLRASLVRKETLAEVARELGLGPRVSVGDGERKAATRERAAVLADALEAVIGAVFVDAGYPAATELVCRLLESRLQGLPAAATLKDAKTRLQEWLQARQRDLPQYQVLAIHGEAHAQTFRVSCRLTDTGETSEGEGRSRRRAEQAAADAMLHRLQSEGE